MFGRRMLTKNGEFIEALSSFLKKNIVKVCHFFSNFLNGRRSFIHNTTQTNLLLRLRPNGLVHFSRRITVVAKCYMDLRRFPMDIHVCKLKLGSFAYPDHELRCVQKCWSDYLNLVIFGDFQNNFRPTNRNHQISKPDQTF